MSGSAAVLIAVIVPIFNFMAVIALEIFNGGKPDFLKVIKGIVKNPKDRINAVKSVIAFASGCGLGCFGISESVITGGDGNIEYVAAFKKGEPCKIEIDLRR